ncbi:MAG TPA: TatD family hydrolase [Edaphocola sp.]|nr:TatD family hydrolase [Edaphocola sp.]
MFLDIHTHHAGNKDSIVNFYQDFEKSKTAIWCSLGIHPWYISELEKQMLSLKSYATAKKVLAIGECGIDKLSKIPMKCQIDAFQQQIDLAAQLQKPLIIHCVRAFEECLQTLKGVKVPVVFHGFNRKFSIAEKILEQGFRFSIGKAIFQPAFQDIFKALPLENIFFETDDVEHIGIEQIYKKAAEIKNIEIDTLILQIEKNFKLFFKNER